MALFIRGINKVVNRLLSIEEQKKEIEVIKKVLTSGRVPVDRLAEILGLTVTEINQYLSAEDIRAAEILDLN